LEAGFVDLGGKIDGTAVKISEGVYGVSTKTESERRWGVRG